MKKNMLLAAACTLLFCTAIFAQKVNSVCKKTIAFLPIPMVFGNPMDEDYV